MRAHDTDADAGTSRGARARREAKEVATWLRSAGHHRMAAQVEALLQSHAGQASMLKLRAQDIAVLRGELAVWHGWNDRERALRSGAVIDDIEPPIYVKPATGGVDA